MNGSEDPEEHFLGQIQGFVPIAKQVDGELDDHALVFGDEVRAGGFVAGCTPLHERRLSPANPRPSDGPRLLH